jgi:hypothetical protein
MSPRACILTTSEAITSPRTEAHMSENIEVIEVSRAEYKRARDAALRDLGLTYEELAAQARTGRFTSVRARKLWLAIGRRQPRA